MMDITGIGHIYVETANWESSVTFWEGLGFSFAERWGSDGHHAGRLTKAEATVVLAEVAQNPALNVFFNVEGADRFAPADGVEVTTPLQDTHWGTRWIRVTDPDGRTFALEER